MFVMDYYGHKLSNGVLFAHHLILDVPGGSSHLGYRRRVPPGHNPTTRVNQVRPSSLSYQKSFSARALPGIRAADIVAGKVAANASPQPAI